MFLFILKWQDNVLMIGERLWFGSFCKAGFTNCEQLPGNSRANGRPQCNLDQNNLPLAALGAI